MLLKEHQSTHLVRGCRQGAHAAARLHGGWPRVREGDDFSVLWKRTRRPQGCTVRPALFLIYAGFTRMEAQTSQSFKAQSFKVSKFQTFKASKLQSFQASKLKASAWGFGGLYLPRTRQRRVCCHPSDARIRGVGHTFEGFWQCSLLHDFFDITSTDHAVH